MVAEPLLHPQDPSGAATLPIPAGSVGQQARSPRPRPRATKGPTSCRRHWGRSADSTHPPASEATTRAAVGCLGRAREEGEAEKRMDRDLAFFLGGGGGVSIFEQAGPPRRCSRTGDRGRVVGSCDRALRSTAPALLGLGLRNVMGHKKGL